MLIIEGLTEEILGELRKEEIEIHEEVQQGKGFKLFIQLLIKFFFRFSTVLEQEIQFGYRSFALFNISEKFSKLAIAFSLNLC